jgi:hypothetical protein
MNILSRSQAGAAARAGSHLLARDFQSLSVFRIAFSIYLLADYLFILRPFFADFFHDDGILPVAAQLADPGAWAAARMLRVLDVTGLPLVVPYLYPLALVAFAAGYRTRLANFVAFVLNAYLFWRNIHVVAGTEDLSRMLLLWSLFLPMNRYWSVDAALDPQPRDRPYPVLPFLAMRLQIVSVYFFAALFKLVGTPWLDGTAAALSLGDNIFGGTASGLYLAANHPGLLAFVTYATIVFQFAFPFLVYSPWWNDWTRGFALAGAAAMHVAFIFCLNIGGFPYVSLIALILLVPDRWWDRLLRERRARLARIRIFYEPGCGFCERTALVLREFLLAPTVPVLPSSADPEAHRLLTAHNSWVVRAPDGTHYLKWRAMAYLLRQSWLFAPLGWLTDWAPLRGLMARLYDWIGASRRHLGPAARVLLPIRTDKPVGVLAQGVCAVLAAAALACNIVTVPWSAVRWPLPSGPVYANEIYPVFDFLQVGQKWSLFAPLPVHLQRRYRLEARLADGSIVDASALLRLWWLENGYSVRFANHRWQKFFSHLDEFVEAERNALGDYFCRQVRRTGRDVRAVELAQFEQSASETWNPARPPNFVHARACAIAAAAKSD